MPRNGSNVFSKPAGTTPIDGDTVSAAPFNLLMDDIAADLNLARPIAVGGTGASTAAAALVNLGADAKYATGPASATADRIAVFDGATGKLIKDGGALVSDLAPKASPALTGTPTTPTPTAGDNSTKIASTAFVAGEILSRAEPLSKSGAGVGQRVPINPGFATAYTLPAGGTWWVNIVQYSATNFPFITSIGFYAGGTTFPAPGGGYANIGEAKRVLV